MPTELDRQLRDIRACRACEAVLPLGPRPVLQADARARILVAGQAPGLKVHESGIPWDHDASAKRLCAWLGVSDAELHDPALFALVPMGFCYPGKGKGGDLPPRPECRALWHDRLFKQLPNLRLKIVIGKYAQDYHLAGQARASLMETVAAWRDYAPTVFPLPHPSPRNQMLISRHPWIEAELLPALKMAVREVLSRG